MTYEPLRELGADFTFLNGWLAGRSFHKASEALHFARALHNGLRKDGVTPEFEHQVFQVNYILPFVDLLIYPEDTIATVILHDTIEDTSKKRRDITAKFGERVGDATWLMTKKDDEMTKSLDAYYRELFENPITSLAKPTDRIHNLKSMPDANWQTSKIRKYGDDVEDYYYPGMKRARGLFPAQRPIYEHLKTSLSMQVEWSRRYAAVCEQNDDLIAQAQQRDEEQAPYDHSI
jgi:(p)ppGpp synthase/HD superfamily hydrolase